MTATDSSQSAIHRNGQASNRPRPKARWHFGIRSRSPPLEVMLEIYKTLQSLGFEWKRKPDKEVAPEDAESSTGTISEDDTKKRRRREEDERVKAGQALYFVEARCPLDDVMVRCELRACRP
jgi:carbon catabolite-derepressing protein kinase